MSVTLTQNAADRVKQYLSQTPGGIGLSVAVKKSGCSGWAYVVDIAKEVKDGEQVFESHGVQVRVPDGSLEQLAGTEIDFVSEGLNQQFMFRNPIHQAVWSNGKYKEGRRMRIPEGLPVYGLTLDVIEP
jgi:iron-sulfur cluster assembly protein